MTNHLTQDVASVPFLWVLPLVVYLFSFVLSFENDRWYRRALFLPAAALLLALAAYGLQSGLGQRLQTALPLYVGGLFCLVRGAARRDGAAPARGALPDALLPDAVAGRRAGRRRGGPGGAGACCRRYYELGLGLVMLALLGMALWRRQRAALAVCGLLALVCGSFLALQVRDDTAGARVMSRNFYGTLSINDAQRERPARQRAADVPRRRQARRAVPAAAAPARAHHLLRPDLGRGPGHRVGAAGAAAHRPDRAGCRHAGGLRAARRRATACTRSTPRCSRWPTGSSASWPTARRPSSACLGDARLALEREPPQGFDVLAVDAFSGDSVPVHLLTTQALDLYMRHLRDGGIVAFHVTNRFLALPPVVERIAAARGLAAVLVHDEAEDSDLRAHRLGAGGARRGHAAAAGHCRRHHRRSRRFPA